MRSHPKARVLVMGAALAAGLSIAPGAPRPALADPPAAPDSSPAVSLQGTTGSGEAPSRPPGPGDALESMWRLEVGYRGSFVASTGYDPFSTNGYLPEFSLAASRTLLSRGPLSFAPGIAWGYGRSDATARGDPTSIEVHRLLVPLEGRLHVGRWGVAGYAFLRVAPGVAAQTATVEDASSPARFTATRWLFAGDVSAGYAYPFWARPSEGAHLPRAWIEADGGYGFVADRRLDLSAALPPGSSIRADGLDLGTVGLRGGFFRLALALSL